MTEEKMGNYWKTRAEKYNNLQWVNDKDALKILIDFCELNKDDRVLDVGCGTGAVTNEIAKRVSRIIAMDSSQEMLDKGVWDKRVELLLGSIEHPIFEDNLFDKAVGRMVFHHVENVQVGIDNCYCMLREGGQLIIQEGVPITNNLEVIKWYTEMMALKEVRHTFRESLLREYMAVAGFRYMQVVECIDENFSIDNWLNNSGLAPEVHKQVYNLHKDAPQSIKDAHDMRIEDDKITIKVRSLMIKGTK